MELFLNPLTAIAGTALVSSPIIIHLINRVRYKRIRWAAMEFLLKAQQKTRRKLIFQQLILLLLRILMILLLALLLGRFLGWAGAGGSEEQTTQHVMIIDDSPSMADAVNVDGEKRQALEDAKKAIMEKVVRPMTQAPTEQRLEIISLSQKDKPSRSFGRINNQNADEVRGYLNNDIKARAVAVPLEDALERAKKLFEESPRSKHMLHLVGDFRSVEWSGEQVESLRQAFDEFAKARTTVFLMDVAAPYRIDIAGTPRASDNLAITDLRPEARVAAKYAPVEFAVDVANYGAAEQKNVPIEVRLNGSERAEAKVIIPTLPSNATTTVRFNLSMEQTATPEAPLSAFNLVSAHLPTEPSGLAMDNGRYAVVEVRNRVPILIVDPKAASLKRAAKGEFEPVDKNSESYYLYKLFSDATKGVYNVDLRPAADLEKIDLTSYATVYLCGLPKFSDAVVKSLEDYVRTGGGLGIFLGPEVKSPDAEWYNTVFYRKGEGVFPAPIGLKPINDGIEDDKIVPSTFDRRFSGTPQILPLDRSHPALAAIYGDDKGRNSDGGGYDRILNYVVVNRYFPVSRLDWKYSPATTQELLSLPNLKPNVAYRQKLEDLIKRIPITDEKFAAYQESLTKHVQSFRSAMASDEALFKLAARLEEMLRDKGDKANGRPNLEAFWQDPANADLLESFRRQIDDIKYGDPLYVVKQFGQGRVFASMTSAGVAWNDLEGVSLTHYPPLILSLNRYLASAAGDLNLIVGKPYSLSLDPAQYSSQVTKTLLSFDEKTALAGPTGPLVAAPLTPRGEAVLPTVDGRLMLRRRRRDLPRRGDLRIHPELAGRPVARPRRPLDTRISRRGLQHRGQARGQPQAGQRQGRHGPGPDEVPLRPERRRHRRRDHRPQVGPVRDALALLGLVSRANSRTGDGDETQPSLAPA